MRIKIGEMVVGQSYVVSFPGLLEAENVKAVDKKSRDGYSVQVGFDYGDVGPESCSVQIEFKDGLKSWLYSDSDEDTHIVVRPSRLIESPPLKFMEEIPKDAFILLGCFESKGMWGLSALQRDSLNRSFYTCLFSTAGNGSLSDAVVFGVKYLKDYALFGAVVVSEVLYFPIELTRGAKDALGSGEVKGCVVRRVFGEQRFEDISLFAAYSAICALKPEHDFVKGLQAKGLAFGG